jgi:hypothetical protein
MKSKNLAISSIIVLLAICSCEEDNDNDNSISDVKYELNEEFNTDGENEVNISFESSASLNISNTKLAISVYGYDYMLADAPATLITRQHIQVSEIPTTFSLRLPQDSYKLIMPESTKENSKFYLSLDWDSDNNGVICNGDITFDFDKKFPSINTEIDDLQSVFMKIIPSTTPCN